MPKPSTSCPEMALQLFQGWLPTGLAVCKGVGLQLSSIPLDTPRGTPLKVTNDVSERACQLATDFHGKITKDKNQQQCLYTIVIRQRRERSDLSRKALNAKRKQLK
jgi:hypothetical protein